MRIAVVSSSIDDAQRLSRAQPGDMQPYFDVHVDGNAVSVSPCDRSDIAHATEAHQYLPTGDLEELYADVARPVVIQACTRQANQGCIVLDGSPLARYNALHEERSGLLRMAVAECCAAAGVDAVEIGFAELDVGDAFVDMFDPQSSHPPHVVDSNPLACCILTGLSTHDGRDPETLELVESLFNPSRHQVVSIALHHHHHHHHHNHRNSVSSTAANAAARSGSASRSASVSAATASHSTTWLYFVSLAVREAPRPNSSTRLGSAALSGNHHHHERPPLGPFRAALQSVTGCISAPQRPSSVPFSQSKLTHLLKGCLCDELQPCAWIVALMPEGPRFRQKPADAFRDACTSIASARRVASICRAASFPRDLVDFTALSPQSTSDHHHHPHRGSTSQPRSPSRSSSQHQQPQGSALQTLAGAGAWLSPTSPGDAALKDAMRDAASEGRRNHHHNGVNGDGNGGGVAASLRFGNGGPASPPAAAIHGSLAGFEHSRQPSVSPRPAEQSAAPQPTPLDPAVFQQHQQEQQRLTRDLDRSELRADSLQRRLDEARERTREAEDEVEDLRKQLRTKHNANHDELARRDENIARLEQENHALRSRLEQQADDARQEADQAIHRLRKQLAAEASKRAQAERTAEVASETAQEATRRANEAEELARAHAAKASEAANSSTAKKREASTAASQASAEARAVSMQFATYRGAMEPTLRRLRADAEKLDAALADTTKQLRNKDRAIARMQTDIDTAQEQIAAFSSNERSRRSRGRNGGDDGDDGNDSDDDLRQATQSADLRAAMAEIQRYQEEVADLTDEVGELQKANADLATSVEREVTARSAKDDVIDGLRLELKSSQQHLADARNDATRAGIAADNYYGNGPRPSTSSASVQTRVGRADFERMVDIEAVLGTEAQMQAKRIKQLEAELDSLQSLGGATDAKRTANERRLLDEQLTLQQRVGDLESDLRAVKQEERAARADATTTAMEVEELRHKLRNLQQPQRANSSVQAGTAGGGGGAHESSHHQRHDMESRAAAARTGQPLHHTHHRSTGLRSPGDDSGAETAPRPASSRARSSSPGAQQQQRRGRSRSGGRSDASGGGITGNFAFRPEELSRVMDMVTKEKHARDRSRSATPQS